MINKRIWSAVVGVAALTLSSCGSSEGDVVGADVTQSAPPSLPTNTSRVERGSDTVLSVPGTDVARTTVPVT